MAKYEGWRGVQGNFRGKVEVQLQLGWLQRNGQVRGMEGSTGQFQRKGGSPAPAWLAAEKGGQVPGMEGSTGQFQRKGGRKSAAEGEQEGRARAGRGWLQPQLQVPEKNKEKKKKYPERRSSPVL